MNDVLRLYETASPLTRLFLRGRVLMSDLEFIEKQVPASGTIVDLGCGHGLFTNLLALRSAGRQVTGIDFSPEKIDLARKTAAGRVNIHFITADIADIYIPECDAITIVDFLYLLPGDAQRRVLAGCRRKLKPGGLLVWKAQERRPRWKYAWTYLEELITTFAGITRGRRGQLTFMNREEAIDSLEAAGFKAGMVEMKSWRPYPDILYLGS
ncbi:MAG: class I SAM-dependent methyltransferase [Actinomycetota bacterium]